jgi:phage shock protein C
MERRLYRSSQNKVLAGVCGGLGEYFGVDPVIVRLLVVVFTLMGGAGLIAYIIAAIIIPSRDLGNISGAYQQTYGNEERPESNYERYSPESYEKDNRNTVLVLGLSLVAIGGLIAFRYFVPWVPRELIFAVILVSLGAFIILKRK